MSPQTNLQEKTGTEKSRKLAETLLNMKFSREYAPIAMDAKYTRRPNLHDLARAAELVESNPKPKRVRFCDLPTKENELEKTMEAEPESRSPLSVPQVEKSPDLSWVSPSDLYHSIACRDSILDVLKQVGKLGPRDEFGAFIMNQGIKFENIIYQRLQERFPDMVNLEANYRELYTEVGLLKTLVALDEKRPIIAQAVLRDGKNGTAGMADLLIRYDVLPQIYDTFADPPPKGPCGYYVVDVKWSSLELLRDGTLSNAKTQPYYKAQTWLYTRMLANMLGTEPADRAYIMGRKIGGVPNCFHAIAPIRWTEKDKRKVDATIDWTRKVKKNGWTYYRHLVQGNIPRPFLCPNMSNTSRGDAFKKVLAEKTREPTLYYQMTSKHRDKLLEANLKLGDPGSFELLKLSEKTEKIVRHQLEPDLCPPPGTSIQAPLYEEGDVWYAVDFETMGEIFEDFQTFPRANTESIITMIGVSSYDPKTETLSHVNFVVSACTQEAEKAMLRDFIQWTEEKKCRFLLHWGHAESTTWTKTMSKYPDLPMMSCLWMDLHTVFKQHAIVPPRTYGFGIKDVARALVREGRIPRIWSNACDNGKDAMLDVYRADKRCRETGAQLWEDPAVQEVLGYNESDCKAVLWLYRFLLETYKVEAA